MPGNSDYQLGTLEASEAIIRDLYLNLRTQLFRWSQLTHQTPQPRMGYVGQHLVSAVTGLPGGRSGARGKDLMLSDGRSAEVKTCYRVDQLGQCKVCGAAVSSVEAECANCGSDAVERKDDSKWLLGPRHEEEMAIYFDPASYYFLLFDFQDLADPTIINARLWEVDPRTPGFVYAMVDYYGNIRAASKSKAPFNLWPFELKFQLMRPTLIYWAQIDTDNEIETLIFPGARGEPKPVVIEPLTYFTSKTGFTIEMVKGLLAHYGVFVDGPVSKRSGLAALEKARQAEGWPEADLAHQITALMYGPLIEHLHHYLPPESPAEKVARDVAAGAVPIPESVTTSPSEH